MDQTRIMNVFNSIPVQLAKENKKFQLTTVEKGARFKDYRGCIEWLEDAGMFVPETLVLKIIFTPSLIIAHFS